MCALSNGGTVIDITAQGSEFISDADAKLIHDAYPLLSAVRALVDAIVGQVAARREKGPPITVPGELARQRSECGSASANAPVQIDTMRLP